MTTQTVAATPPDQSAIPNPQSALTRRGLTLIEIMVVVGIIAILVAIFVPVAQSVAATAKTQAARGAIASIEAALASYTQFWKPLSPGQQGWKALATVAGRARNERSPLTVPGLPPLTFGVNDDVVWDAFGSRPARVVPHPDNGGLWLGNQFNGTPLDNPPLGAGFQANQCLAWALTAQVGDGPFFRDTGGQTLKTGAYKDPVTDEDPAPGVGHPLYPNPRTDIPTPKVTLVDPWGRPYLYGWEVEVGDDPGKKAKFRKAWIASMGPDRDFDPATWIRDAKKATDVPVHPFNADNIVP